MSSEQTLKGGLCFSDNQNTLVVPAVGVFNPRSPSHRSLTLHFEVPVMGKEGIILHKRAVLNEQPTENILEWPV